MDFSQLKQTLDSATEAYDQATRKTSIARSEETAALNALNDAQQAFDAAVENLRKGAPHSSDWHNARKAEWGV